MTPDLRSIRTFKELTRYLEEQLDWPLDEYEFDELTFTYDPPELGLKPEDAVKVHAIHQLRPFKTGQPWGIFFVEFEKKRLPIVILRRILRHLVLKKRASANAADAKRWQARDLLFISAWGDETNRELTFAHFVEQSETGLAELRVLGWDNDDTPLHMNYVAQTLGDKLRWDDDFADNPELWRQQWSAAFLLRHRHVIRTSGELATALAELARNLRSRIKTILRSEDGFGEIRKLQRAFQTGLIHDLDDDGFADMFAQTVTYGLFSVSVRRTFPGEGTAVTKDDVPNLIFTSPFLKEMLGVFLGIKSRKGAIDFDELGVSDVTDLLTSPDTHMEVVLADFNNKTRGEDPVIHFYEHFLSAYNKQLKIQRGVFYTPQPVVSYIVRSVHELLQTEFGLADGLADTTTWGAMLKKHPGLKLPPLTDEPGEKRTISPDEPFVQILDPATGTATFLVEVIEVIHKHLQAKWKSGGLAAMPGVPPAFPQKGGQDARPPFLDPYSDIDTHEHHLPHWQQGEVFYFVTWRLADALPSAKLAQWQEEKEAWLRHHPEPWDSKTEAEFHRRFSRQIDGWLDAGHGSCILRQPALSSLVGKAFHHFDGERYDLDSFVVMPNHVHVLFRLRTGEVLEKVIHSWKSFTAKEINKATGRASTLWQEDYWDRIIRNERHLEAVRRYIKENPKGGPTLFWQRSAGILPALEKGGGRDARAPFSSFAEYWNAYVPAHLLPRLHAFELMMAPYAIAHMKIGLKLAETGYRFGTEERARIYLTNALEPKVKQLPQIGFDALAHEAAAVNEIKWYKRFTVVIGNPPYSPSICEPGWLMRRLDDWKQGLNEAKSDLNREEWKFLRLAQYHCQATGAGIVGFIINRDFLDGIVKRRMREHLGQSFPLRIAVDLNGDVKGNIADENVFEIEQGVTIAVLCTKCATQVLRFASRVGTRAQKYADLFAKKPIDTDLTEFEPAAPYFRWQPAASTTAAGAADEYAQWMPLDTVFTQKSSGIQTKNDPICIAWSANEIFERVERLALLNAKEARAEFELDGEGAWTLANAQADLRQFGISRKNVRRILYRPLDFRFTYYTHKSSGFLGRPRYDLMRHMVDGRNIGLIFNRQIVGDSVSHFAVSRDLTCHGTFYLGNKGQDYLAPLYLHEDDLLSKKGGVGTPNFTSAFTASLRAALGSAAPKLTPEDIFHYAYAVFHSPGYRSRYAEFLKIDFPRLPLTGNLELFRELARLGGELVALHLLESKTLDTPRTEFFQRRAGVPPASSTKSGQDARSPFLTPAISKVGWTPDGGGTVWIDAGGGKSATRPGTSGFRPVPEPVWNFHIGGYQVCQKWLKDRKGRALTKDDLAHYQKIVVALSETIRLMAEIDKVIEQHGGWPDAFQAHSSNPAKGG